MMRSYVVLLTTVCRTWSSISQIGEKMSFTVINHTETVSICLFSSCCMHSGDLKSNHSNPETFNVQAFLPSFSSSQASLSSFAMWETAFLVEWLSPNQFVPYAADCGSFTLFCLLYHQLLFIEIDREKTSCIYWSCFIHRVTCYDWPVFATAR